MRDSAATRLWLTIAQQQTGPDEREQQIAHSPWSLFLRHPIHRNRWSHDKGQVWVLSSPEDGRKIF